MRKNNDGKNVVGVCFDANSDAVNFILLFITHSPLFTCEFKA